MKGVFLEPPQVDVALTFFAFLAALVSLIGLFLVASYEATFAILLIPPKITNPTSPDTIKPVMIFPVKALS